MKKILFIVAVAILVCSCGKKNSYTITGNVTDLTGTVALMNDSGDSIAEAPVTDGKFTLTGTVDEPSIALLTNDGHPMSMLFLEPGKISVTGTANDMLQITGTKANDSNTAFTTRQYSIMERFYGSSSEEERHTIADEMNAATETALNENLDNYFGLYLLTNVLDSWSGNEIISKLNEFPTAIQDTKLATQIRKHAEAKKLTDVGNKYTDIVLPNVLGNDVALSSLVGNGKYVLLDFWASWCGPCMREIPYLVKAYELYRGKGFEIYGVSLDRDEQAWKEALTANNMSWINVSAINDTEQKAANAYAVQSIPANFLIGPDGTIVAKNLRGEELESKIAELLNK